MKKDEEARADRDLEFETDDEENEAEHDGNYSPSSSSSARSSAGDRDDAGRQESFPQPSWPQSYRQSIDMMSNFMSPNVGFLAEAGSSLIQAGSTFLRPMESGLPSFTRPLLRRAPSEAPSAVPSSYSKASFAKSSYLPDLPPSPQCSTTEAIINGINVLCGVGILSMPYAVKEGGWLGIGLLFMFCCLSCYTGILLKECLDSSPAIQTYPDVGQAAFGTVGRISISIILYIELYACCVEYITLVTNSLQSIFPGAHIDFIGLHLNCHQLFALTSACLVLPTVWLRDLSLLSYLSAGGVLATVLVVICLFWVGTVDGVGFHHDGPMLEISTLPVALGLYGFCYSGHSIFPNIYSSMKTQSQFPAVLMTSFAICTVMYFGVAVAGFRMFGESIKSQYPLNMPRQFLSSKVAVWTTVVNPLTKYALTLTPVALSVEELLPSAQQSRFIVILIRTLLVMSTLAVSLTVPFFGLVMALLGSLFTMLVALILPCACYLSIKRRSVKFVKVSICILIIMVGVTSALIGSYSSIKQIAGLLG